MNKRFDLKEHLGGGGYGDVYRAVRRSDGAIVAVKVLRDDLPEPRRRFEREIRILREYTHPCVMKILEADLGASPPYYAMPFYQRGTLKSRIGKVSPEEFLALFEALVGVLAFLEERGAFHRDLKPDNIMIDDEGRPVLSDFGLSSDPALTANFTRHFAGTPGYIAPELSRRRDGASPKCDIYSLGATAFQLLTGVHPGDARTFDLADHLDAFPPAMRAQILMMVDPEPSKRPGATELLAWLRQYRQEKIDPVVRKAKRVVAAGREVPPWLWPLLIVILLAAAVGGGVALYSAMDKRKPRRPPAPPPPAEDEKAPPPAAVDGTSAAQ